MAERAGISVRGISDLERGVNLAPRLSTFNQLAAALDLSPRDRTKLEEAARGLFPAPRAPADRESGTLRHRHSLPIAPLIGRSLELGALRRHLVGDGPPLLLFGGEPGIGKTRLLHEAIEQGEAAGFTVLAGGSQRRSGQVPYAPLVETLSGYVNRQAPAKLRAALHGCAWLARLLPELLDVVNAPLPLGAIESVQERRLIFSAVATFLENVGGPTGVLLVLDDLQWTGMDALDLLGTLVRAAHEVPLRVVGAYRDSEVGPADPLLVMAADLVGADLVRQILMDPLVPEEAALLLQELAPDLRDVQPGVAERVLAQAGGVPFFLVSWTQGLAAGGSGLAGQQMPWSLAQTIRQRLAALPDEGREVLGLAAVIGRNVPQSLLLHASEHPEAVTLVGLDSACSARLLVDLGNGTYQFAHDVIREVAEVDLGGARRALLHRRIGETLEHLSEREQERRAAELAWHFQAGDDAERGLKYARLAGDQAERVFALTEAERHYRTAVDLAHAVCQETLEAEVLEKLGWVLRTLGRYDESLLSLEQAAAIYHTVGNLDLEGQVLARIGWALSNAGRPVEGIERLRALAARLEEEGPKPALVTLYNALGHLLMRRARYKEWEMVADRAAVIAERAGDDTLRVHGALNRGLILLWRGSSDEALAAFEVAAARAEACGDGESAIRALTRSSGIHYYQGKADEARERLERAVELAERMGSPNMTVYATWRLGDLLFLLGEWQEARARFERAVCMTPTAVPTFYAAWPRLGLAELCTLEGRRDEAIRYEREILAIVEATGDTQSVPKVERLRARRDLWDGRPDSAADRLEQVLDQFELEPEDVDQQLLAEARLLAGNSAGAERLVASGVERASAAGDRLALTVWFRLRGMVKASQWRWAEAEEDLSEAIAQARLIRYPYGEASAEYEMAAVRSARTEAESARKILTQALAIYRRLGAVQDVERTEKVMAEPTPA